MTRNPSADVVASARRRIVDSARELFASHGFGPTSIKRVARHAGVSQGLMYTYFASKDDLLRTIFEDGLADVWSTLPPPSDGDPVADLESLLRRSFATVAEHQDLWRLLYALRLQPAVVERLSLDLGAWGAAIEAELVRLCGRAGCARPDIEAKLLFAIVDGANQHRTLAGGDYPVEDVIAAAMERYRPSGAS